MNRLSHWVPLLFPTALLVGCGEDVSSIRIYHPLPRPTMGSAQRAVLITCDTLRADMLGAYGDSRGLTPSLDTFAAEAVVFDRTFAPSTITVPSLSSMFTGLTPKALGAEMQNQLLVPESVDTLAEILAAAGIATGAFVSNWVLGLQEGHGLGVGLGQGFDTYNAELGTKELNRNAFERLAPDTSASAISWLEERQSDGRDDFFLWVHYIDPHGPYTAPAEIQARFDSSLPAPSPEESVAVGDDHSGQGQVPKYQALPGNPPPSVYRSRYEAEVFYMDRAVGELLDWLREQNLYEDTLIIFSADHGEALGEHDYWFCHGESLLREQAEIPLIVRFPRDAGVAQPARRRQVSSLYDVRPTVLEAFGYKDIPGHGWSLFDAAPDGSVVAQELLRPGERSHAVYDGRYHLVHHEGEGVRLFDLDADPAEEVDLGEDLPAVTRRLQEAYERDWLAEPGSSGRAVKARIESDQDRAALEALGYAGDD